MTLEGNSALLLANVDRRLLIQRVLMNFQRQQDENANEERNKVQPVTKSSLFFQNNNNNK